MNESAHVRLCTCGRGQRLTQGAVLSLNMRSLIWLGWWAGEIPELPGLQMQLSFYTGAGVSPHASMLVQLWQALHSVSHTLRPALACLQDRVSLKLSKRSKNLPPAP